MMIDTALLRRVLAGLLVTLAVLLAALGVLMGFHVLAEGLRDEGSVAVVRWAARVCLVLLVLDVLLLVFVLGLHALHSTGASDLSDIEQE